MFCFINPFSYQSASGTNLRKLTQHLLCVSLQLSGTPSSQHNMQYMLNAFFSAGDRFLIINYGRRSKIDFLVIGLYALGLALLMKTNIRVPQKLERVLLFLGKITYPVYIFQMPIIELIFGVLQKH